MKIFSVIEFFTKKSKTSSEPPLEKSSFKKGFSLHLSRRRSRSCDPAKRNSKKAQMFNRQSERAEAKRIATEILEILDKKRQRDEVATVGVKHLSTVRNNPLKECFSELPLMVYHQILARTFSCTVEELDFFTDGTFARPKSK